MTTRIVEFSPETVERIRQLGIARQNIHGPTHFQSARVFSDPYVENTVGVMGEVAFSQLSGLPFDDSLRPSGDKGVDFIVNFNGVPTTLDIKMGQRARHNLVIKANHRNRAELYLYGFTMAPNKVCFCGYITDQRARTFPIRLIPPLDREVHIISVGQLDDLAEFLRAIKPPQ